MIAVIDTNFLVRYFTGSKDLGEDSKGIFENNNSFIIIPSIVLVELKYLAAKQKIPQETVALTKKLLGAGNCMVYPLDENLIEYILTELDIHDGIIFATAIIQSKSFKETIYLLTKDEKLKNFKQDTIQVIW